MCMEGIYAGPLQVVRLTPPGRGAVATLRVEGAAAVAVAQSLLATRSGRPLAGFPWGRLVVGRFGPEPGEEVVVRCRSETSLDLHCHGGPLAATMIEQVLVGHGCRLLAWQDWLSGRREDPLTKAARLALAEAPTVRTAAILLDQYHGALRRALDGIEAAVAEGNRAAARRGIDALQAHADVGRHLTTPWQVVLAGWANAGKSSLLNALLGYQRVIVHNTPGTTRDVVTVATAVDGWPVALSDTAGWGPTGDPLAATAAAATDARLAAADLIVLAFDASLPWSPADEGLLKRYPKALLVHTKCDLVAALGPRPAGLSSSARTGRGVDDLLRTISTRLVPHPPPAGAAVPFSGLLPEDLSQ